MFDANFFRFLMIDRIQNVNVEIVFLRMGRLKNNKNKGQMNQMQSDNNNKLK